MDGDEKRVIEHAIAVSEKFNAKLTAIHVNDEYAKISQNKQFHQMQVKYFYKIQLTQNNNKRASNFQ